MIYNFQKMILAKIWYKIYNIKLLIIVKVFKNYKNKVLVLTNYNNLCWFIYIKSLNFY